MTNEAIETVEEVEAPVYTATTGDAAFTGISAEINELVEQLCIARDAAAEMEAGLTQKSKISKASTVCRAALKTLRTDAFELGKEVLVVRADLLDNVGEVQAVAKKESLLEQQKKIAEQLAALEG